jgi:hypothetical protein
MPVPISNVTRRQVYAPSGTGGAGPYAFTFEILANTDIAVYKDDVLLTLTTHYTVTINANGTGSVTITATGLALSPTSPTQYAIVGNRTISRTTDFTTGGDFFANTLNDELDQQTIFAQQNSEGLQRALQAPQTDPTTVDMTLPRASVRANKTLAFDANGDPTTGEVIGDNRGNWSTSTAYNKRDIVKDTSNGNIYYANTSHTSTGSQPISTNADSAKWDLIVDNASAGASATAAAASASAASTSASNASTSASNASTSATNAAASASTASTQASNASTSATNAASSASSAASSASSATSSASTATTQASNASTSASNASTSASNAATSATNAATSATTQASNASTSATNASNSATSASTSASTATTQATNASNSATSAATSATNASNSATAASTSATNAANSETAAANSATTAAAAAASGMYSAVQDKSANYTVVAGDAGDLIRVTTTSGAVTITLPTISTVGDGFKVAIVKWTGDANAVTVNRSSTNTINGATSATIGAQYSSTTFVADLETGQWFAASSGLGTSNVAVDAFSGNNSTTAFTLSGDPGSENNTQVYVSGVYQEKDTYSVSGTTLTFSTAPPTGTSNIEVVWTAPLAIGTPSDGTVTTAKIASSVTLTTPTIDTITSAASTALTLKSAGTTAVTIDTAQNVGVGVTPSTWTGTKAVEVGSLGTALWSSGAGSSTLANGAYYNSGWKYANATSKPSILDFDNAGKVTYYAATATSTAGSAISLTQLLAVEAGKSLALEGATTQTGTGIAFPATQSASSNANTLDDYEEGTFTPTVQGVSSAGTATYSTQLGAYTKIGNLVYVNVYLSYTGGTGTGQLRVANLPFTSAGSYIPVASVYLDNIAYTANSFVQAVMNSNATTVDYYLVNGGGSSGVAYDAAGVLIFSLTYRV